MVEIAFREEYSVQRNNFSEEIRRRFSFVNQYFSVLIHNKPGESKNLDECIKKIITKDSFKQEYKKLTEKERLVVRDLINTFVHLQPEFLPKEVIERGLAGEEAKGKKSIFSRLKLLKQYIAEKEQNEEKEKTPMQDEQHRYYWKISAVGSRIYGANAQYIKENNFEKIA